MKISFTKKTNSLKPKKDGQVNHHRFWIFFITIAIIVLTIEIIFFTYIFVVFSKKLDEPVLPMLDTNSIKINTIEKSIGKTEKVLSDRVLAPSTSQNNTSIVQ